jgi:ATP synthase protein I
VRLSIPDTMQHNLIGRRLPAAPRALRVAVMKWMVPQVWRANAGNDTLLPTGRLRNGSMKPQDDLRGQVLRSMALTMAIGVDLACVLLVCVLIGHYVDGRWGTGPWGLLAGIVLGLAGGAASAYRMIMRVYK